METQELTPKFIAQQTAYVTLMTAGMTAGMIGGVCLAGAAFNTWDKFKNRDKTKED